MDPVTTAETGGAVVAGLVAISKPAEALIQRVSDALGVLYEPTRIKRAAHAEAEADRIRALGNLEVSEIEQRGLLRMVREQGRIQGNIESITQQAANQLPPDAHPEDISDDWLALFFDKCKLISDAEMQQLWSRILAEQSGGKKFCRKTIELVSTLEKTDAEMFTVLCGFIWHTPYSVPLILDSSDEFYRERGASYGYLKHLESLGLISYIQLGYNRHDLPVSVLSYFCGTLKLSFPDGQTGSLEMGQVMLTQAGVELATICKPKAIDGLPQYLVDKYQKMGLIAEWIPSPN